MIEGGAMLSHTTKVDVVRAASNRDLALVRVSSLRQLKEQSRR